MIEKRVHGRLTQKAKSISSARPRQLEDQFYRIIAAPNPLGNRAERRAAQRKMKKK